MKKRTDKKNAGTLRELARRALVVLLTVSMVSMNSPLAYAAETGAMAKSEPAQAESAKAETMQSVEPKAEAEVEVAEPAATEPAQAAPAQTDTTEQLEATEPSSKQEETNDTKNSDATVEIVGTKSDASQGEVDVKLSFTHAYIHYNGQSIGLPTKSVTVPADQEFRFVAVADEGFVLKQVTMTRNGAETALEADADGTFVVPAADVVTGLTVSVEAEGDPFVTSPTTKPIEEKRNEKSTFEYEDADVKVTATLTDPAALPADVTFKVTPITRDSKDAQGNPTYNYDAYMEALNKSVGETNRYTPENTLLYDVGFFTAKKDEKGAVVAGEQVEVQLEEGLVQLDFQFKKNQLSDNIKATDSSHIQIEHLPLRDSVRSSVESTAAASNISADDIIVETPKDQNANVGSEQMSLKLDSLSGIAAVNLTPQTTQGQPAQAEPAQNQQTQGDANAGNQGNRGTSDAGTTQAEHTNLADFLTYAYFGAQQNANNQYVVKPGESYKIMLTFAERYDFQFPNSDATMRYKLPEGLESADGHDGTFTITIDDRGTSYAVEGNHYDIREITNASGKKELWLEVQFNKNSPNFRKLTSVADAAFTLSFWGTVKEDATELLFKDGINKELYVDTSHSVKVSKSASQSNDSNEMNYTVAVRSTGNNENVQVSDVLTCATDGLLTLDANSFQITSSKSDHNVSGLKPTISGNNFSYVIPEMSDGELITIRYKATIHPETIMPNAEDKYVSTSNNRVEVWSDGDTTKKDEQSVNNTIDYTPTVSKASGAVTCGENNKQTISWTINANPKCAVSMAGTDITDSIAVGSREIMKYSGTGITIVVKDASGNVVRTDNVPWSDLPSHSDATWTYHVSDDEDGAYSYTITYTTEVDMTDKVTTTTVNNTVTTGGSTAYSGADVTPAGGEINVSKQATKVDLTNGTVSWRVTFNVPAAGLDSAEVVDNYLSAWVDDVKLVERILPDTVDVIGLIGKESYQKIPDDALGKLTIKFFKTGDQSAGNEGLQSSPTDRIIYVDFKTEINESWVNASTRGEAFTYLQNHTNTVWFNANGGSKSAQGTASVVPGMEKSGDIVGYRTDANGVKLPVYKYELVIANVSTDSVEVSDKFDTSILSYYTGTEGIDNEWYQGYVFGGSIYSQDYRGEKFAYVETTDGITMTTSTLPHNGNDFYPKYKFVYYLTVKDANALQTIKERAVAEGGVYKIHNSASYGKQSTGTDIEYKYEGLKKKLLTSDQELINNPKIHPKFEITLNSGGMVLNDGNPLTVKDTVSSSLSVDLDSIRAEPSNGVTWDMSGNTVTYTIPDATPVTITYTASIILSEALELGQTRTISFSNEAEMLGYSDKVEGSVTRANNGEGTGSSVAIRIMKYKAGDMTKRLSGAKFELQNEDGTPVTKRDGSPLPYFESGPDGMIEIYGNSETDNWSLQKDKTYLLEEKEAPAGYTIVAGKNNGAGKDTRYRFTISSNGVTDYANRIYPSNDILTVKNYPGTDVRVLKEWLDNGNHDSDLVVVKLLQKREDEENWSDTIRRETETGDWVDAKNVTIELKNDNNWEGYFYKLPTVVPKEIDNLDGEDVNVTYRVDEVSVNGEAPAEGTVEVLNETAPNSGTYVYRIKNGVQEEKGDLTVKKVVEPADSVDANKKFVFTVTLYDANDNVDTSINGTKGDMQFENGVATVDIKKDEEKTATDLPVGTKYTVTETEESKEGFVPTGEVVASNKGEISANTPLVKINNAKEQTGGFKFKKVVTGTNVNANQKFRFTIDVDDVSINGTGYGTYKQSATTEGQDITFTSKGDGMGSTASVDLAAGGEVEVTGLPVGATYRVTEAKESGFTTTTNGADNTKGEVASGDGTVTGYYQEGIVAQQAAQSFDFTFTNAHDEGAIVVQKAVQSDYAPDLNSKYTFQIKLPNASINNTAAEGGSTPYGVVQDGDKPIPFTIAENGDCVATVELAANERASIKGLPAGTEYEVTELNVPVGMTCALEPDSGQGTITTNETKTVTATNSRGNGKLELSKSVVSNTPADMDTGYKFKVTFYTDEAHNNVATYVSGTYKVGGADPVAFSGGATANYDEAGVITLKDGETAKFEELPLGLYYEVEEQAVDGMTTMRTNDSGQIAADTTSSFTNSRIEAGLSVTKEVKNAISGDETKTFKYFVALYTDAERTKLATHINAEYPPSALGEHMQSMNFSNGVATFELSDGATAVASGLPAGLYYRVIETVSQEGKQSFADYTPDDLAETDGDFNVTVDKGTVEDHANWSQGQITQGTDADNAIKYTNTRKTGNLQLSKNLPSAESVGGSTSYMFRVKLYDGDQVVSDTYGDYTFDAENGAQVSVPANESVTISGLPIGLHYTVTEVLDDQHEELFNVDGQVEEGNKGTITTETKNVEVTNTRKTGGFKVKKTVASREEGDSDKDFAFTVTLSDNTITGQRGDLTFNREGDVSQGYTSVARFNLKDQQTVEVSNLPTGITYTVTEAKDGNFVTTTNDDGAVTNGTGTSVTHTVTETTETTETTDDASLPEIAFTNTRQYGFLKLQKTINADGVVTDNTFTFDITSDAGYNNTVTINTSQSDTQVLGPIPTGNYTITETGLAANAKVVGQNPRTVTVTAGATASAATPVVFVNSYNSATTHLEVTKAFKPWETGSTQSFSFELTPVNSAPMPANPLNGKWVATATNDGNHKATFGNITYTKAGNYEYHIQEVVPVGANAEGVYEGVKYDKTVYTAIVTVEEVKATDGGAAKELVVSEVKYQREGQWQDSLTVTNTYYQVEEPLEAEKGIFGRENNAWRRNENGQIAEDYTFELGVLSDNDPAVTEASLKKLQSSFGLAADKTTKTATTQGDQHKASFGAFKFTAADVGKIFKYTVKEVLPKNESGQTVDSKDGVTYSKVQYDIIYTPYLDKNEGNKLKVRHEYKHGETEEKAIHFENTYAPAETSVKIQAKKRLQGRQITDGEFSFDLYYVNPQTGDRILEQKRKPASHAEGDAYNEQTKTDAATVTFKSIPCSKAGTETYVIKEVIPEGVVKKKDANGVERSYKDGVFYDESEQEVQITTYDDQMGHLTATVEYLNNGTESLPTFTNTYFGATANIEFDKAYYGKDPNATFGFTMEAAADEDYKPRSDDVPTYTYEDAFVDFKQPLRAKAQNPTFVNGVATVKMPTITYHEAGTYYYTITEDAQSGNADVQPDRAAIRVKVVVGKDANATVDYALYDDNTASEYTRQRQTLYNNAKVSLGFRSAALRAMAEQTSFTNFEPAVRKVLKNGVLKGGEFEFAIYEGEEAKGDALKVVPNDANGRVSFGNFTYGPSDVGRPHTYTIVEVAGNDETVVYDADPIKLTVDVKLNASGAVEAKGTYEQKTDAGVYAKTDDPTFVNEYDTIIIHAVKRSREEPYDPLPGAHYGLWMVNPNGEDVYMGLGRNQQQREGSELVSSDNGDLYYDIPLLEGVAYYFLEEWPPPAGHLVDPYPTDYFTLVHDKENGKFRLVYEADPDFAKYCPDVHR